MVQSKQSGFTLIEVLIVMVIISIVGGVTLLTISHNQTTRFEKIANQITQMLSLSEEQSLLQSHVLGLGFTKNAFQIYQYDETISPGQNNTWHAIADNILGLHTIPNDMQITVKVRGKVIPKMADKATAKTQPQLIIATSGNLIPFTILIGKAGAKPRYQVKGFADGSIVSGTIHG